MLFISLRSSVVNICFPLHHLEDQLLSLHWGFVSFQNLIYPVTYLEMNISKGSCNSRGGHSHLHMLLWLRRSCSGENLVHCISKMPVEFFFRVFELVICRSHIFLAVLRKCQRELERRCSFRASDGRVWDKRSKSGWNLHVDWTSGKGSC